MVRVRRDGSGNDVEMHAVGPMVGAIPEILDPRTPGFQEGCKRARLFEDPETLTEAMNAFLDM